MSYLQVAKQAAQEAGDFLKENFHQEKQVNESSQFDIKIELDVITQKKIEAVILASYPDHAILGEEGIIGSEGSDFEWILDPIDGTVNYYYGIPHFCVSIALREKGELILGVIYDPMVDELWSAEKGGPAYLNDQIITASSRTAMAESIVFVGHGKTGNSLETGVERFGRIAKQVRKMRITGSAALACVYVASGRFDAYVEGRISIWDIAAGLVILEAAGGKVELGEIKEGDDNSFSILAWNGKIPIKDYI